ncbi:MAG: PfkB family carbohydrate kinase, partial [Candidatus Bathyarchaeia archaeon]
EDIEGLEARAVHISPIANEVPVTLIERAVETIPIVSLDPQGILRQFDAEGRVFLRGVSDLNFLKYIDIFKASESELKALTGLSDIIRALKKVRDIGVNVAIATIGAGGVLISLDNSVYHVPAAKQNRTIDPTGAGDSFMGGFLAEYIKGEDLLWCASVGSSVSSYVIEEVGPGGFRGKRKVYERARWVYERIVRVTVNM